MHGAATPRVPDPQVLPWRRWTNPGSRRAKKLYPKRRGRYCIASQLSPGPGRGIAWRACGVGVAVGVAVAWHDMAGTGHAWHEAV